MFRCQKCHRQSKASERPHKVVMETRQKQYLHRDPDGTIIGDTFGTEIVKESELCLPCMLYYTKQHGMHCMFNHAH